MNSLHNTFMQMLAIQLSGSLRPSLVAQGLGDSWPGRSEESLSEMGLAGDEKRKNKIPDQKKAEEKEQNEKENKIQ